MDSDVYSDAECKRRLVQAADEYEANYECETLGYRDAVLPMLSMLWSFQVIPYIPSLEAEKRPSRQAQCRLLHAGRS